ncbi:MAG: GNAT family N-acetyltransferase [Clostridia bacterium]|nr:GNAT family N-acetyltransferase [Clostridia bacterium]
MRIRRLEVRDALPVSEMIIRTLKVSNSRDYLPETIRELIMHQQPEDILSRASWTHFYVAEDEGAIIGCGAIGPYYRREDESCLFTFFVSPDHQRRGVGRKIMETLEHDTYFLRARRVEIPASVTGLPFYLKMGYSYKDGITSPDEEGLLHLEKKKAPVQPGFQAGHQNTGGSL